MLGRLAFELNCWSLHKRLHNYCHCITWNRMIYVPLADNLVNTPKEKNRLSILSYNIYLRIGNR